MKDRACGHAHARRLGIDAGPRCENVSALSVAIRFPPMQWSMAGAARSPNGRGVARKQKVSQSFQADLPGPASREKTIRFARDPNQS
jgi:hypothetical protein